MKFEIYKPAQMPASLVEFWSQTKKSEDEIGYLVNSPEWYLMMVEAVARSATNSSALDLEACVAVLLDDADKYRALLPLLPAMKSLSMGVPGLNRFTKNFNNFNVCGGELIGKDVSSDELSWFCDQVFARLPNLESLWFDHVRVGKDSDLLNEAIEDSRQQLAMTELQDMPHFRIVLPATFDKCKKLRSSKSRSRLANSERHLCTEVGSECQLVELRRHDDWMPYADRIVRLMNTAWQAEELGHGFSVDDIEDASSRGWLRSFLLMAGDKVLSFALCYQADDSLIYERIGYDQQFAKHSPGSILLYKLLERLYQDDTPKYVDIGEGEASYKRQWANDIIEINGVLIARKSAVSRSWYIFRNTAKMMSSVVQSMPCFSSIKRINAQKRSKARQIERST